MTKFVSTHTGEGLEIASERIDLANVTYETENFIGGQWRSSRSGKTIDVLNPATGGVLTSVAAGDADDVADAVAAADAARASWRKTTPRQRMEMMLELADRMSANEALLGGIEV